MMKKLKYISFSIVAIVLVVILGVKDGFSPVMRENITDPVFTIGDLNYSTALQEKKQVMKFGKLFWGAYPGGLAFKSPEEAVVFIAEHQEILDAFSSGWGIYKLSASYSNDTYISSGQAYMQQSALVIEQVELN